MTTSVLQTMRPTAASQKVQSHNTWYKKRGHATGDIGQLLEHLQTEAGIREWGGLLDEMLDEARYTSPEVRQVMFDLATDGLLEDELDIWADDYDAESGDAY